MLIDIVEKQVPMKPHFSTEAKSLLELLLERNPERRLGSGSEGTQNVMEHPFFKDIEWC